ncbi:hypothetical protein AVEN_83773-1 [Araneus ventricosus]|uniref:Uncharacterized protein n=1 Tax=Araneus ventricosus TaxID=182803 RepID=A0A4Y2T6R5_ARAVE|nr:hypothetical protein AVEN_83773-1 [Araneus ventricosus]
MNFGDIAKSYLTYLQTHYGSNVAVVFDGYPSDANRKSTKSAERIRREHLHSSHEIIFNEATCPEISQEQFLANERKKMRIIDLLKRKKPTPGRKNTSIFNSEATIDQVAKADETFLIHLFGGNSRTSACDLNHLHYTIFTQSATKARSTLARLPPPTVDAARFHALRSYLQIQKWLGHEKNPLERGWVPTRFGLSPRKMERHAAHESLLKIISCSCQKGFKNACGCRKAGLIRSSLRTCSLGKACENVSDINLLENSIEDEDDNPSSINNFIYEDIEDLNLQLDEDDKEQQTKLEDFRPAPSRRQKL